MMGGEMISDTPEGANMASLPLPDMSILDMRQLPAPAFPLSLLEQWQGVVETAAEAKGASVDYVACALLTAAASAIGNARFVSPWEGWDEPCCLWMGLIGNPSSNKTPALSVVTAPMKAIETQLARGYQKELLRWEAQKAAAKLHEEKWQNEVVQAVKFGRAPPDKPERAVQPPMPQRPRLVLNDATVEKIPEVLEGDPRGFLYLRDELSGWLGGMDRYTGKNTGGRQFWLEAYNGQPYAIDRKNRPAPLILDHLTVSVLGGVQPDRMEDMFLHGPDDGLVSRFLWCWPEGVFVDRPSSPPALDQIEIGLSCLRSLSMAVNSATGVPLPTVLRLDDEAANEFQTWRREVLTSSDDASGLLVGHLGKHPGMGLRLALVLEHLWWAGNGPAPGLVSISAVLSAAALLDGYFRPMAERCYGVSARPAGFRKAAVLARHIAQTRLQRLNVRELYRGRLPGLADVHSARQAVEILADAQWLFDDRQRDGGNPGRQREDYRVNPRLWEVVDGR